MKKFSIKKINNEQKKTRKRILEISYESKLSHIGSCLSAVDIIDAVYQTKRKSDKFVLSNGHAGIALYVILEKYGYIKNPKVIKSFHIHPDRNPEFDIQVSTGSLGQGLPIALGMAFANKKHNIYCMISDGECTEGSIWEALRVASEYNITNLIILVNANGWGAYSIIKLENLEKRLKGFGYKVMKVDGHNIKNLKKRLKDTINNFPSVIFAKTSVEQFSFLKGQDAHYYIMRIEDYQSALKKL